MFWFWSTYPELIIMTWWTFLDEGSIVCSYVSVVRVFLQHVDFQLYFFLFILRDKLIKVNIFISACRTV